jgi:hypothetical protein
MDYHKRYSDMMAKEEDGKHVRDSLIGRGCQVRRRMIVCALATLMLTIAVCTNSLAQTTVPRPGSSPLSPAPTGLPVKAIVECGKGYISHELYDATITVLEIVRGAKAWDLIKEATLSNKPPNVGFEYILARIRFEYFARGFPGECSHELRPEQFTAVSANGKEYKALSVVPPKPELSGRLHSGDSLEGWVAFLVLQQDRKPMTTFTADVGGAILHGGGVWFQLY